jgi:PKD repeat protein
VVFGGNGQIAVTFDALANAAPQLAADAPSVTVAEGMTATNSGSWSDPNLADILNLSASVGSITTLGTNAGGTWTWSYSASDGPADSQTVTITADDGTTSTTIMFDLVVTNVSPTADLDNDGPIDEGSSASISFSNEFDPSTADTTAGFHYSFDCSGVDDLAGTYADAGTATSTTCTFTDNGSFMVHGRIFDKDNGYTQYSTLVTVSNVAPSVDAGEDASIDEGSTFTGSGDFSDPGADTWTATVDYGDGSGVQALTLAADQTFALSHTYADDGVYTVTVTVSDDDGGTGSDTVEVTVSNVAPTPDISDEPASSPEGTQITLGGSATDPSSIDTAAGFTFTWGVTKNGAPHGSGQTSLSPEPSSSFSFTPDDNGTYEVTLTATDKDGDSDSTTVTITVTNVAPTITSSTFSFNPFSGVVSSMVSWTDPGSADTQTVTWSYFKDGVPIPVPPAKGPLSGQPASGSAGDTSTQLPSGCYSLKAVITVTDDDGGTTSVTKFDGPVDIFTATFQAPIKGNERNIAKWGNVVPVKVGLSNCAGESSTLPTLYLTAAKGTELNTYEDEVLVTAVNGADYDQVMRVVDSKYMYNLSTKGFAKDTNYEVRIRVGAVDGPIIARAVLFAKK